MNRTVSKIREYWDIDGHIEGRDNPKKEYDLYKNAFETNYDSGNSPSLTLKDFEEYINFLNEENENEDL